MYTHTDKHKNRHTNKPHVHTDSTTYLDKGQLKTSSADQDILMDLIAFRPSPSCILYTSSINVAELGSHW